MASRTEYYAPTVGILACCSREVRDNCGGAPYTVSRMLIHRSYKTELNPTPEQAAMLGRNCGCARFAFNWALGERIKQYQETGKSDGWMAQCRKFNALKQADFAWAYECDKWAHQSAIKDCDKAFQNFFRRVKNGDAKKGFPKFKSKHRSTPKYRISGENVRVESSSIRLGKTGWIRLARRDYIPVNGVKINSVTISQRAGRWFVSVQVEEDIVVPENQGPAVGIDLGLSHFCVGSDGSRFDPPQPLARSLKKLRRLSRRHSRKQKGSNNRRKAAAKLAKLHFRISCQRSDFIHKASDYYTSRFGLIGIEDLHVAGMLKNKHLSRAISDAGWGEFRRQVEYKASWRGGQVVAADQWFPSSKTCNVCGVKRDKLPISVRQWTCECGEVHDRDGNASLNLEHYARAVVNAQSGPQGSTPVEIAVGRSLKQEAVFNS